MCHTFSTSFVKFSILCASSMRKDVVDSTPHDLSLTVRNICYKFFMAFHYHCCVFVSLFCRQWHSGKSARNYMRKKFLILNIRALNYQQGLTDACFKAKPFISFTYSVGWCYARWHAEIYFSVVSLQLPYSSSVRETEVKH